VVSDFSQSNENENEYVTDDRMDELNSMVQLHVDQIIKYNASMQNPEDPLDAVYDMLSQCIAYQSVLFFALKELEDRISNVSQDS